MAVAIKIVCVRKGREREISAPESDFHYSTEYIAGVNPPEGVLVYCGFL